MTIEYKDGRYFIAQIFLAGEGVDYLAAAYRDDAEGAGWVIQYRFRYYASDDPHDERDEKSWYIVKIPHTKTEAYVSDLLDRTAGELVEHGFLRKGEKLQRLEFRTSNGEEIVKKLMAQSYTHVRPTGQGGDA